MTGPKPRKPRKPRRPPSDAAVAKAAREIEAKISVGAAPPVPVVVDKAPLKDWKTSIFGALAVLVAVAGAALKSMGYEAPGELVNLLVGILAGSGLMVARDGSRPTRAVLLPPTPDTPGVALLDHDAIAGP